MTWTRPAARVFIPCSGELHAVHINRRSPFTVTSPVTHTDLDEAAFAFGDPQGPFCYRVADRAAAMWAELGPSQQATQERLLRCFVTAVCWLVAAGVDGHDEAPMSAFSALTEAHREHLDAHDMWTVDGPNKFVYIPQHSWLPEWDVWWKYHGVSVNRATTLHAALSDPFVNRYSNELSGNQFRKRGQRSVPSPGDTLIVWENAVLST